MSQIDMPTSCADDLRWWRAPLVVTLLGLPLLAWQYALFGAGTFVVFGGVVCWGSGLVALAWVLPQRRSARMLRTAVACAGLVFAILPLMYVITLSMALTSS